MGDGERDPEIGFLETGAKRVGGIYAGLARIRFSRGVGLGPVQ